MSLISRSDLNMASEKGGDWFQEFLKDFAKQTDLNKPAVASDNLSAQLKIQDLQKVEAVVARYRIEAGVDLVATASAKTPGLSKRAALQTDFDIQQHPEIAKDIEEFAKNTGGTRDNHSIINHIRQKLNNNTISFADVGLNKYIDEAKAKYKKEESDCVAPEAGTAGKSEIDQKQADYTLYTGKSNE